MRVGLEDNLWLEKGHLATNAELVARAVTIVEAMGVQVMTPDEVRAELQLTNGRTMPTAASLVESWLGLGVTVLLNGWDVRFTIRHPIPNWCSTMFWIKPAVGSQSTTDSRQGMTLCDSIADAVTGAEWIQESTPSGLRSNRSCWPRFKKAAWWRRLSPHQPRALCPLNYGQAAPGAGRF